MRALPGSVSASASTSSAATPKSSTLTAPPVVMKTLLRLEVAVHDVALVRAHERADHRHDQLDGARGRDSPVAGRLPEVGPLQVLEHSCRASLVLVGLIDDDDVWPWLQLAVARASRRKSWVSVGDRVTRTLIATRRPRRTSRAR